MCEQQGENMDNPQSQYLKPDMKEGSHFCSLPDILNSEQTGGCVSATLCLVLDNQATSLWETLERQDISNHVH